MYNSYPTPSLTDLIRNSKRIDEGLKSINVALLSDSATQLLAQGIKGMGVCYKLNLEIFQSDYDQIDLQIFSPDSELYKSNPDFIIIYKSSIKLRNQYYKSELTSNSGFSDQVIEEFQSYIDTIRQSLNAKVVICNFVEMPDMVFNNFGNKTRASWIYHLRKINFSLMDLSIENSNAFICDLSMIQNLLGRNHSFDPTLYVRSSMDANLDFIPEIARSINDIIAVNIGDFKKCLILDLDNTLWGGIIGDDGIENIQLGNLGIGKAFAEIQLWAKMLKQRGIILAVCSKNTEAIAKEPFENHPDMILTLDDISVFVANWNNKADNIRYIQSILNIGFDSMVFLDDNPYERNLIRSELPEVTVPELPSDPSMFISFLQRFNLFETISFSKFDSDRTLKYQVEAKRVGLKKNYTSIRDYLKNLEMVASTISFNDFHTLRIAQLTQRSNQFNLRTIRYSEDDIKNVIAAEDKFSLAISLKDKFGDYGLISVIILERKMGDELFIDTWIMSCRVLKREVENFALNEIVSLAKEKGFSRIVGHRIPTKKNILVENHYNALGFKEIKENEWELEVNGYSPLSNFISSS